MTEKAESETVNVESGKTTALLESVVFDPGTPYRVDGWAAKGRESGVVEEIIKEL